MNVFKTIVLAAATSAGLAHAADKKAISHTELIQRTAVVESVDPSARAIRLKSESGEHITVLAGTEVRNFAQIKAGDRVVAKYMLGIAAQIKPRGTSATAPVEETVASRAQPGQQPGAAVRRSIIATVAIDSVDTSFNTVTFRRADGVTRVVGVDDPEAQRFIRTLKPGDVVEISYSEALAVSVEPAAAHGSGAD